MAKLNLFPSAFIFDIGLALPTTATKCPTSVLTPECLISNHDGLSFPSIFIVRSHLPSNGEASGVEKLLVTVVSTMMQIKLISLQNLFFMNDMLSEAREFTGNIKFTVKYLKYKC